MRSWIMAVIRLEPTIEDAMVMFSTGSLAWLLGDHFLDFLSLVGESWMA